MSLQLFSTKFIQEPLQQLKVVLPPRWRNIAAAFFLGFLVASGYWYWQAKQMRGKLTYTESQVTSLTDQISELRNFRYAQMDPSPTPRPISYGEKETLTESLVYKLDCGRPSDTSPSTDWFAALSKHLTLQEKVVHACLNVENASVVYLSMKPKDPGGYGSPPVNEYTLGIYDPVQQSVNALHTSEGSYLGGSCTTILAWTRSLNIYYKCGGGDGPWGAVTTYRVHIPSRELLIAESCTTFEDKTECTTGCKSSADCKAGYFCNLENNSCVRYCQNYTDCVGGYGSCIAYGPVRGCQQ